MSDPVSWLLVERGWTVRAADGEQVGTVHEVTGSREDDIFDGLTVRSGVLARPQYVAAEDVAEIREGVITLALAHADFEGLPQHEEPPRQERLLPEQSSWWLRLLDQFRKRR